MLERVCVRAMLETMLTVLGDVVGWRQLSWSSRNKAQLAFAFPVPLAGSCSKGQNPKLHWSYNRLFSHVIGEKMCELKKT